MRNKVIFRVTIHKGSFLCADESIHVGASPLAIFRFRNQIKYLDPEHISMDDEKIVFRVTNSASVFKIKYLFLGYFDLETIFLDNGSKYVSE